MTSGARVRPMAVNIASALYELERARGVARQRGIAAKAGAPANRSANVELEDSLVTLLEALEAGDSARLREAEPLREKLHLAIEFDPEGIDEGVAALPAEHRARLIAWLAGVAPYEPAQVVEPGLGELLARARAPLEAACSSLWADWSTVDAQEALLERGAEALAVGGAGAVVKTWRRASRACFDNNAFAALRAIKVRERLGVVYGFDTAIKHMLFAQAGELADAVVVADYREAASVLRSGGAKLPPVTFASLGSYIVTRTQLDDAVCAVAAHALALALPAHQELLPRVNVEIDGAGCLLTNVWIDSFAEATEDLSARTGVHALDVDNGSMRLLRDDHADNADQDADAGASGAR